MEMLKVLFPMKVEKEKLLYFQALATAVSGTVGNGNIAGVALAMNWVVQGLLFG